MSKVGLANPISYYTRQTDLFGGSGESSGVSVSPPDSTDSDH